ncbi:helix-turn-helix transcriptional regulator [Clostridium sp.]|uniref:helix-turn-helix domain-containing protein n=1 Tax=Clostridium sp. TaxID=1506 RepID=UPI0029112100|nr:helix-turn-helix transcriptional regulator [Clostridium sp.]MDU7213991.1 helix-turn-helix transcriptional regulator [Clostridium sp.]
MSRVGEKIKEVRTKAGLTQKALGKKLGVSDKFINEVEMGRRVAQEGFIERAAKILNTDLNDISMVVTDEALMEERKITEVAKKEKKINAKILGETSPVWTDAFSSVMKKVIIYDYSLKKELGSKELPIYSNKVEGYPADKVLYIKVEDNSMSGFRMMKDDIVFGHLVKEVSNNGMFLIEYDNKRVIRQIKSLGGQKLLLIGNDGSAKTETIQVKEAKIIAKLERLEIQL